MDGTALQNAYALLPDWIRWGPYVAQTLLNLALSWGFIKVLTLWRGCDWRCHRPDHWVEQARVLYPMRSLGGLSWLFPALAAASVLMRP
ncbi:MAG: hypothetical protein ABEN55_23100, partial [Bradymonadaceae bacterium]